MLISVSAFVASKTVLRLRSESWRTLPYRSSNSCPRIIPSTLVTRTASIEGTGETIPSSYRLLSHSMPFSVPSNSLVPETLTWRENWSGCMSIWVCVEGLKRPAEFDGTRVLFQSFTLENLIIISRKWRSPTFPFYTGFCMLSGALNVPFGVVFSHTCSSNNNRCQSINQKQYNRAQWGHDTLMRNG